MVLSEDFNGLFEAILHLSLDDFLTLSLDNVLAIVLAHLTIGTCCKTNDRLGTCVANIDSNQHGLHVVHFGWELQMEKIALYFRVDLPEDVRSFAHVE